MQHLPASSEHCNVENRSDWCSVVTWVQWCTDNVASINVPFSWPDSHRGPVRVLIYNVLDKKYGTELCPLSSPILLVANSYGILLKISYQHYLFCSLTQRRFKIKNPVPLFFCVMYIMMCDLALHSSRCQYMERRAVIIGWDPIKDPPISKIHLKNIILSLSILPYIDDKNV